MPFEDIRRLFLFIDYFKVFMIPITDPTFLFLDYYSNLLRYFLLNCYENYYFNLILNNILQEYLKYLQEFKKYIFLLNFGFKLRKKQN